MKKSKVLSLTVIGIVFVLLMTWAFAAEKKLVNPPPGGNFAPIPVTYVYPPVKALSSAQEEKDSGKWRGRMLATSWLRLEGS